MKCENPGRTDRGYIRILQTLINVAALIAIFGMLVNVQSKNTSAVPLKGDMDGDGVVSASDARSVLRTAVGLEETETVDTASFHYTENYLKDYNIYLFHKIACIGDSQTRGFQNDYPIGERNRDIGYPEVLTRITGIDCRNFGISGVTADTWLKNTYDGYMTYDFSSFDCAFIMLGRNFDVGNIPGEKVSYRKIINKLRTDNPQITIFCLSLPPQDELPSTQEINTAIEELAQEMDCPYIDISSDPILADAGWRYANSSHCYSLGYVRMAVMIRDAVNSYIEEHLDDFKALWASKDYPRLMADISFLSPYPSDS